MLCMPAVVVQLSILALQVLLQAPLCKPVLSRYGGRGCHEGLQLLMNVLRIDIGGGDVCTPLCWR